MPDREVNAETRVEKPTMIESVMLEWAERGGEPCSVDEMEAISDGADGLRRAGYRVVKLENVAPLYERGVYSITEELT